MPLSGFPQSPERLKDYAPVSVVFCSETYRRISTFSLTITEVHVSQARCEVNLETLKDGIGMTRFCLTSHPQGRIAGAPGQISRSAIGGCRALFGLGTRPRGPDI